MTQPLRIGILGAARIATKAVVAPATAFGAEVVAVAARDQARATAFAAEHGIGRAYGSYADLLADPAVQVVYNPSPNSEHVRWTLAALRAGKHVLAEKPFGSNADEARLVAAEPNPRGLVVFEAFHYRYHPAYLRLLEVVGSGRIGEITALRVGMKFDCADRADLRWSWPLSGGSLMDLGCYALHVARDIAGVVGGTFAVESVETTADPDADARVDATATILGTLPGGGRVRLESSLVGPADFSIAVTGTKGSMLQPNFIAVDTDDRIIVTTAGREDTEHHGTTSTYTYQLAALRAAINEGTPFPTTVADGVTNMEFLDNCYRLAGLPLREGRLAG